LSEQNEKENQKPYKPITDRDRLGINVEVNIAPPPTPVFPELPALPTDDNDGRASKKLELSEAVGRYVPDGIESVAIGGMHMHNNPMGFVREIIRQGRHIKRLITGPGANIGADLLIGAGLVEEIVTSYIGLEHLGLAPAFRRLAREGAIKVYELDALTLMQALHAGAANAAFAALPAVLESNDLPKHNPEFYGYANDPFTGRQSLVVRALRPALTIICAQQADKVGNGLFKGSPFVDREMVFAAQTTLLQVEQIITTDSLTRNPQLVTLPGYYVQGVVEIPFSGHPTANHRFYHYDEEHIREYSGLAATAEGFKKYLDKYVYSASEIDYLAKTSVAQG
jgi:glutaconate CoA-transferase, subunit A